MTNTQGDNSKKLVPESERSDDEQVLWLAFSVLAILGLLVFGMSRCGAASDLADNFTLGGDEDGIISLNTILDDENDLDTSASFFADGDFDRDLGDGDRGPFTVFAPSDDAWDASATALGFDDGSDLLDALNDSDPTDAAGLHIVEGRYTLSQLQSLGSVTTIGGDTLVFGDDDLINGVVSVEEANIEADNGYLHKIDGLFGSEAPAAEPEPEPEPEVEEEAAAAPDPTATPEPEPTATPEPEPTAVPAPDPTAVPAAFTIADLATEAPDLTTLTGLVGSLGLDAALADADAGPFTVFAPTNEAFESAGEVIGALSDADVDATVQYHVVPGLVPSSDVVPGARFETLSGETLVISSDGSLPGGVGIVTTDLEADNGLVHVIDQVLIPADVTLRNLTAAIADLEGIQFDVGSATIRAESQPILVQAASVLRTLPEGTLVEVAGHTDSDGGADGNQALSEARANSVVAYLVGEGVDADLLTAVGYGEADLLVDPETSDADKQANRRIEFVRPRG